MQNGQTPLGYAIDGDHHRTVEYLITNHQRDFSHFDEVCNIDTICYVGVCVVGGVTVGGAILYGILYYAINIMVYSSCDLKQYNTKLCSGRGQ